MIEMNMLQEGEVKVKEIEEAVAVEEGVVEEVMEKEEQ